MRTVTLYIAMSLDGYIADEDGRVDWLGSQETGEAAVGSYETFRKTIDTVVMGYRTYEQVVTLLSPEHWPYEGLHTYVVTHRELPEREGLTFTDMGAGELLDMLKQKAGKDIWICGGANLVNQLLNSNKIDRYHISIAPVILGRGICLFKDNKNATNLKFISSEAYGEFVELIYENGD